MIKCPNPDCGHENVPGTQFCEGCGEELPDASAAGAPAAGATVTCPACDNVNPAENQVCEVCGADLGTVPAPPSDVPATDAPAPIAADVATAAVTAATAPAAATMTVPADAAASPPGTPTPATPAPASDDAAPAAPGGPALEPGRVKLVVEQGMTVGAQFVLGDVEVQVGREDEEEGIYPDIDLSDQDAGYVHRRHATLKFEDGRLTATHLGGANKTRINNRPLPDNEPQPVQIGDKLAFGKVVLRVHPA